MRVLRIHPAANDPRPRRRELALVKAGIEVGLVLPWKFGSDWNAAPVEPAIRHWRSHVVNRNHIPLHLWDPLVLRRAVAEFNPDVVDIHEEPFFPAGFQGVLAAGRRPTVMYSAQNLEKTYPFPIRVMQRHVLGRVNAMYPCSTGVSDLLRRRGYSGPLEVLGIGVDDELFEVRSTGDRIGFIGRLVPEKGVRHLLDFGKRLLCVGDGPLAGEVRDAGGEVRPVRTVDQLAAALSEMGVLVAPSLTTPTWKEQFGRMLVEGMAAGVPVVAYASGSIPEVLGKAGVVVAEGDQRALRQAIDGVLENSAGLGELGRERARSEFTWDAVAAGMVKVYRAALEQRRAA